MTIGVDQGARLLRPAEPAIGERPEGEALSVEAPRRRQRRAKCQQRLGVGGVAEEAQRRLQRQCVGVVLGEGARIFSQRVLGPPERLQRSAARPRDAAPLRPLADVERRRRLADREMALRQPPP